METRFLLLVKIDGNTVINQYVTSVARAGEIVRNLHHRVHCDVGCHMTNHHGTLAKTRHLSITLETEK